jgi:hypothetical protein
MFRKKESRAVLLTDALECMFPCNSLVNFAKYDTFDRFNSKLQISFKNDVNNIRVVSIVNGIRHAHFRHFERTTPFRIVSIFTT